AGGLVQRLLDVLDDRGVSHRLGAGDTSRGAAGYRAAQGCAASGRGRCGLVDRLLHVLHQRTTGGATATGDLRLHGRLQVVERGDIAYAQTAGDAGRDGPTARA